MSRKRRNTSSAKPETPPPLPSSSPYPPSCLQARTDHSKSVESEHSYEQPQINIRSGQVGAFPGLGNNAAPFYGPAQDGVDYLRMVRSEALTIPDLLSAASVPDNCYNESDYQGFFNEDEAYVAAAQQSPLPKPENCNTAQLTYYKALLAQHEALRAKLELTPPLPLIQTLSEETPISFPPQSKNARTRWENCISHRIASSVQVACMDSDSVLQLIRFITKRMRKYFRDPDMAKVRRRGSWLWAMLAKCPDRGELGSEDISDLRALARSAHAMCHWLQDRDNQTDLEEGDVSTDESIRSGTDETGPPEARDGSSGYEARAASSDLQAQTVNDVFAAGDAKTRASSPFHTHYVLLDMIVTVVGEVYGQRDLLDLRQTWRTPCSSPSGE